MAYASSLVWNANQTFPPCCTVFIIFSLYLVKGSAWWRPIPFFCYPQEAILLSFFPVRAASVVHFCTTGSGRLNYILERTSSVKKYKTQPLTGSSRSFSNTAFFTASCGAKIPWSAQTAERSQDVLLIWPRRVYVWVVGAGKWVFSVLLLYGCAIYRRTERVCR